MSTNLSQNSFVSLENSDIWEAIGISGMWRRAWTCQAYEQYETMQVIDQAYVEILMEAGDKCKLK